MSEVALEELKVVITPLYENPSVKIPDRIGRVEIALMIPAPDIEKGFHIAFIDRTSPFIINGCDVDASDKKGQLHLTSYSIDEVDSFWVFDRKTIGDLKLLYYVWPQLKSSSKYRGWRDRLYWGNEGWLGSGASFIPNLALNKTYRNIVEWRLVLTPERTRAIWTHGEGPAATEKIGPASVLSDSVYMIGSISSNPPTPISGTISDYYGYYWFGDLPPNIETIKSIHHHFYLKASEWFSSPPSSTRPFRTFIHSTGSTPSFTGTSFPCSHVFSYSNQINEAHDYDLIRRMTYSIIDHFLSPIITKTSSTTSAFIYEGMKHCLSIYFPFRFKFRTGDFFRSTINMLCTKYYTNPLMHLPQRELLRLADSNVYAKEALSSRAWAFVLSIDLRARHLSDLVRPVEDLAIKPLAKLVAEGKSYDIEDFCALMEPLMGNEVQERYKEMLKGTVIQFPISLFGAKTHYMKRVDQEVLDFGYEMRNFENEKVMGLKLGSTAMAAGLQDGDKILSINERWRCFECLEAEIEIVVMRDRKEEGIRYRPRGIEKVVSWQLVEVGEEEEEKNAYLKIRSDEWGERA